MKSIKLLCVLLVSFLSQTAWSLPPSKDLYQVKIYRCHTNEQLQQLDAYFKDAYLPALHKAGIKKVGVFKPLSNDTASNKAIYLWIPFSSEKDFFKLDDKLKKDEVYMSASKSFREAPSTNPAYDRIESMLLEAFEGQKHYVLPAKNKGTVFEWRSYESPTENLHEKKMLMFEKEEITLFKKLQFNTLFYAKVISGSRMPNFVYMPTFKTIDDRNEHWKVFGADPDWKAMQANPLYESKVSVSRNENFLMYAADYSDL
jgi:hypothetical protein